MRNLLAFKNPDDSEEPVQYSPFQEEMHARLWKFHRDLIHHCSMPTAPEDQEGEKEKQEEVLPPTTGKKLLQLVWKAKEEAPVQETTNGESASGQPAFLKHEMWILIPLYFKFCYCNLFIICYFFLNNSSNTSKPDTADSD